jgi:hypothetical protein
MHGKSVGDARFYARSGPYSLAAVAAADVVWNPCRGSHLGQRSCASAPKAGHMDASDLIKALHDALRGGGRPHMELGRPTYVCIA